MPDSRQDQAAEEIVDHYTKTYDESQRLTDGFGGLERARTEELIRRYLPEEPAVVLDVGGGTGVYAFALAALGHDVHLIDIVPTHIEQAKARAQEPGTPSLAGLRVGDARDLEVDDAFADVMLMHGPLYHLTAREDRRRALTEAARVLKPGGTLLAFAITRYAGALYGLTEGLIYADDYRDMIRREIETGERIIVGVNEYEVDEEPKEDIEEVSEAEQRRQRERLAELREDRDNEAVEDALAGLKDAATSEQNVMPHIIDAVKAYATTGEICNAMRDVFGEYDG